MFNTLRKMTKLSSSYHELNIISKRFAGHSKWANIRHIKGLKDAERANLFQKLSRQIKVAVTEGGSIDPNANLKLEQVLAQAKRACMPAATVQSVLKSIQSDKKQCKTYILEIMGPGSSFILCEVFTDALHVVKQNMASILKKHGSKYCDGIGNMFHEKGIVETEIILEPSKTKDEIIEKATDDAIEVGAEEVSQIEENVLEFVCGSTNLKAVSAGLENCGYNILSASVEYIPFRVISLNEKDMKTYSNLYDKLDKLPEVIRICHNIQEE